MRGQEQANVSIVMQARESLPQLAVAWNLAPRERASYMKAELGPMQTDEDSTILGGGLDISLRAWMRQVLVTLLATGQLVLAGIIT